MTRKLNGWEDKLLQLMISKDDIPFEWGKQDCMTLACDSIEAMTGIDVLRWARGEYKTKQQAIDTVIGHFGWSFKDTFSQIFKDLGFEETDSVGVGDIAFIKTDNLDPEAAELFGGVTLATCFAPGGNMICPGKDGLLLILKYEMVIAWRL